ncbi:hypothetical protein DFH27DRAFT_483360 [Peziza echinospora]|nr:hypothetical protein DFH27DRAFT_483360 [Peziza echinospora]
MKIAIASAAVMALFSSVVTALPQQKSTSGIFARAVSPDGTCGGTAGFTCSTTSYKCCSQYGWCGDTVDHCGTGCQSAFGTCTGGTTTPPTNPPTTSSTTSSTTSQVALPTEVAGVRTKFGAVPYGVNLVSCTQPNTVAITFDDGPYIYTETLLNIFRDAGAKATFFVNGANWGAPINTDTGKQALLRRMIAEGHQIGSHTWSHADLSTLSIAQINSEMKQLEVALYNILGKYPTYMRPPYLSCGATCNVALADLGYHVAMTNLDTQDWQYDTVDTYWNSQNIFKQAVTPVGNQGKWLVLAHDVHQMTAENIGRYMIKKSREIGLNIVTVGECFNDPAAYWYRTVL